MKRNIDLINSIKENSPAVYRILRQQQSQKWEITTGSTFKTTDNTTVNKNQHDLFLGIKEAERS